MLLRAGFSRQQYQRLEASGNPRLDTLELLAKGLDSELLLIPNEKLAQVLEILASDQKERFFSNVKPMSFDGFTKVEGFPKRATSDYQDKKPLSEDPWTELFGEDDQ